MGIFEEYNLSGLTGYGWSRLLIDNPGKEILCDKHNGWKAMSGDDWLELLKIHPQFMAKAESHVNGVSALIALDAGRAASFSAWKSFGGGEWLAILSEVPQLSHECDKAEGWRLFSPKNWTYLLKVCPQFECKLNEYSDWSKIEWYILLASQPQFARYCDGLNQWEKLNDCIPPGSEWAYLLSKQPQFIDKCDSVDGWHFKCEDDDDVLELTPDGELRTIKNTLWIGYNWRILLEEQPRLAYKLDELGAWECLDGNDWFSLLKKRPEFAVKCGQVGGWRLIGAERREELIKIQPQLKNMRK